MRRRARCSSRGRATRSRSKKIRELFARRPGRPRPASRTTLGGCVSRRSATSAGGTEMRSCLAMPHTRRTSRSDRGRSSPWRTPSRWPPRCTSTPTSRRPRRVRGRAPAGGRVHPARSSGEPGVVREPRPVHPPGADAVRVQHPHPVARVTYDNLRLRDPEFVDAADIWFANHEVRRGVAPRPRKSGRRCSSRSGSAASR